MSEVKEKPDQLYKDSQKRLIGSLLVDSTGVDEVFSVVRPEDFDEPKYSVIYQAIQDIVHQDEEVTAITVAKRIDETGQVDSIGGFSELESLLSGGVHWITDATLLTYAGIVREGSVKHKVHQDLINAAKETFVHNSGVSAKEGIEILHHSLNEVMYSLSDETHSVSIDDNVDNYLEILKRRQEIYEENKGSNAGLQGIPSNLPTLNELTGGWMPEQLITVAARTGVGKTVFAVNSAVAAARANKRVLFFSLEMNAEEIQDRIYSSISSVPMNELKKGNLSEESKEWLAESLDEFRRLSITVDTTPELTIDDIRARAIKQAQSPEGLDMVIIDYLGLVKMHGRFNNEAEELTAKSRTMKLMARQLNVPIMQLAQVKRESDDAEDDTPKMSQIRGSSQIAADSNIVIVLHRKKTDEPDPRTYIILEKNRNGQSERTIVCRSDLACSKFEEIPQARSDEQMQAMLTATDEEIYANMSENEAMFDDFDQDLGFNENIEMNNNEFFNQDINLDDLNFGSGDEFGESGF